MTIEERYAAAEAAGEARRRARMRRQPLVLIGLVGGLVLGIGVVASVDLRRLETPQGVALRWTQAAVFGDCDDYLAFSVEAEPDVRAPAQLCRDLRESTKDARANNLRIGIAVGKVRASGSSAVVELVLTDGKEQDDVEVQLVRRDGKWKVLRDERTCGSVGCA